MGRCLIDFDGPAGPVEVCVPVSYCHPELGCMCGGDDDACYPGMQCFGRSPESEGRCEQFCYDDWDCPSGRLCERDIAGVTRGDGSGYRLCGDVSTTCDPFTGSGCRSGEACLILPPDGWFSCLTPGTAGPDEPCDASGCVSGSGCFVWDTNGDTVVGSGDEFRCFAYCTLDGSSHPCPVDHTCRDDLGHAEIGLCVGP
jgi:hypothetical protein